MPVHLRPSSDGKKLAIRITTFEEERAYAPYLLDVDPNIVICPFCGEYHEKFWFNLMGRSCGHCASSVGVFAQGDIYLTT